MLISLNQGLSVSGRFEAEERTGDSDQSVLGLQSWVCAALSFHSGPIPASTGRKHTQVSQKEI